MTPQATGLHDSPTRTTDLDVPPSQQGEARTWSVQACGLTDTGRVRSENEDQFLIATLTKALQVQQTSLPRAKVQYSEERGHLFLVADGMGGHRGGEQASALAVDEIEQFMLNTFKWFFQLKGSEEQKVLLEFRDALYQTDARIIQEATRHPELWGMGTTLTMAYCLHRDLFVVHVGDSRCYLFHVGTLHQITRDHTLVGELVRRGSLSPEEASEHHWRHVITNVVGGTEPGVQPEVHKVHLESGDVLLLCSDGLTEMLSDEEIAAVLQQESDPRRACDRLVKQANEHGGKDNVTVIVARFEG
jgi:protein phosphatase